MTGSSREMILRCSIGLGVTLIGVAAAWYQLYLRMRRKNALPEKWTEVGRVTDLFIYPLKSGRSMRLETGECEITGLVYHRDDKFSLKDRGILVYTEEKREMRNAKRYRKLLLISVAALNESEIKFEAGNSTMSPFVMRASTDGLELTDCTLWEGEVQRCFDCGNEAAKWISQYCTGQESGLRLGFAAESIRNLQTKPMNQFAKVYENITNDDLGIFSDISSYMILNKGSLDDLNDKLSIDVSPLNFRPNIVVEGPEAYVEDHWDWIKIGDEVTFRSVKPCTRCTMVNFDPETGVPAEGQMVLKKLKEYRQITDKKRREVEGSSPVMGFYAGIRKPGRVKIGDKIYLGSN